GARGDGLATHAQEMRGPRMGGVLQRRHRLTAVVIADLAGEDHHRAVFGPGDRGLGRGRIQWLLVDPHQPNAGGRTAGRRLGPVPRHALAGGHGTLTHGYRLRILAPTDDPAAARALPSRLSPRPA